MTRLRKLILKNIKPMTHEEWLKTRINIYKPVR